MNLLGTLLTIFLVILGLLGLLVLFLLALLLFAPLRVAGRGERWPDQRAAGRVLVHWLWRLVGLEVIVDDTGQAFVLWLGPWAIWRQYKERGPELEPWERIAEGLEELIEEVEESEKREKKEGGGPGWPLTWRETLAQRGAFAGVLVEAGRAIVRILRGLRWERLRLRGRVGLGNPAYTGMLYGVYEASRVSWSRVMEAHLAPEFAEAALWGEVEGAVRVYGWRVLWPLARWGCSRPIWRLAWALARGSWRNWRRGRRERRWRQTRQREALAAG